MADQPKELFLQDGLRAEDVAALSRCLSGMGVAGTVTFPVIAPAMLLGDPELAQYAARMLPDPDRAMVHESQGFTRVAPVPLGAPLKVSAGLSEKGAARVFDFALADGQGGAAGTMQTRLRQVSPEEIARFRGSAFPPHMDKGDLSWCHSRPFDGDAVAAYLALARDPNPIHVDDGAARAVGLERAVVPGMFFAGVIECAVAGQLPEARLSGLKLRFMAPVPVGEMLRFGVQLRVRPEAGVAGAVRVFVLREDKVIAAIADLETVAENQAT